MYAVGMPLIRAQMTLQGKSGIPEDQFVNTYWFNTGGVTFEDAAPLIVASLDQLYTAVVPPNPNALSAFMSGFIADNPEVRLYNMEDLPPRIPEVFVLTGTFGQAPAEGLPEEVALCVSFHGAPPITARRRGRVYIGPLNINCLDGGGTSTSSNPVRPSGLFVTTLQNCFSTFLGNDAGDWWVVRSETSGLSTPIVGGWIDNSFDTQRRRGVESSVRTTWVGT